MPTKPKIGSGKGISAKGYIEPKAVEAVVAKKKPAKAKKKTVKK